MKVDVTVNFMAAGRGAWNSRGIGGTLSLDGTKPGMYYRLPASGTKYVGSANVTADDRAVKGAVKAYQGALNRRLGTKLTLDGILGPITSKAIVDFQKAKGEVADGAIGPKTSKSLLINDLATVVQRNWRLFPASQPVNQRILCGLITQESGWDAGAVGTVDNHDLGLMQINGDNHDYTEEQRLDPMIAFQFAFDYLFNALNDYRSVNIDDAIASYNLGLGGMSRWITQGRPILYWPSGSNPATDTPRRVWDYINTIKTACS